MVRLDEISGRPRFQQVSVPRASRASKGGHGVVDASVGCAQHRPAKRSHASSVASGARTSFQAKSRGAQIPLAATERALRRTVSPVVLDLWRGPLAPHRPHGEQQPTIDTARKRKGGVGSIVGPASGWRRVTSISTAHAERFGHRYHKEGCARECASKI